MSQLLASGMANKLANILHISSLPSDSVSCDVSYHQLKSQTSSPALFSVAVEALKLAEKGKLDIVTAVKRVQRLSFKDPKTALALLDKHKNCSNETLNTECLKLHASLSKDASIPVQMLLPFPAVGRPEPYSVH